MALVQGRRDALQGELIVLDANADAGGQPPVFHASSATSPTAKLKLFRQLFRGREDVFPVRWTNARTGKSGYAPACANKFVRGVCELPRIKCSECPNQAFLPVEDQVILDHLQGRHVIGVYPLLPDETCWFLAMDFDKSSWQEDVLAVIETCRAADVSIAVERSRSGNGAHVWFFSTRGSPRAPPGRWVATSSPKP
ncbi:MAG: hypothetical protein WCE38_06950 [Burkholderiales bacterium]